MRAKLRAVPSRAPGPFEKLLEVSGLRKVFDVNGGFLTVLDGVEFSAAKGEMICIVGRSGCGKSTLLKILAGFLTPSAGAVYLNGRPVSAPGTDRCVVFQEDALFPWLTVRENIAFGLRARPVDRNAATREVDRFLELVGLTEFGGYLPREISGGMRQRVALARVLILKPSVLLMDEPFGSLDAQTRNEMTELLLSLWKRLSHTILFVTHDVDEAVILADRILLMGKDPGRIREQIAVDLPRPRRRDTNVFMSLAGSIYEGLSSPG